jgi:hypothetical protein
MTQGYTNPGRQVVRATFCTVARSKLRTRNAWNLLHVNHSGAQNAEVASRLFENLCTPDTANAVKGTASLCNRKTY